MSQREGQALGLNPALSEPDGIGDDPKSLIEMFEEDDDNEEQEVTRPPAPVESDEYVEDPTDVEEPELTDEEVAAAPAEGDEHGAHEGEAEPPGTVKIADRYDTLEQFEKGYKEIQGGFTRVAQENQQLRAQLESAMAEQQQIVEYLRLQAMENDPELAEQLNQQMAMQQQIEQQVAARVEPLQQQVVQRQVAEAAERSVRTFFEATGIAPGSQEDQAVTNTFAQLRQQGVPLDITNPQHLQLALEAATQPAFAAELAFNPRALEIPGGVDVLRQRVGATIPAGQGAPTGTPPRQQKQAARRRIETHVETGNSGAPVGPPPGEKPESEFDEAWDWYKNQRSRGPLFGSSR